MLSIGTEAEVDTVGNSIWSFTDMLLVLANIDKSILYNPLIHCTGVSSCFVLVVRGIGYLLTMYVIALITYITVATSSGYLIMFLV